MSGSRCTTNDPGVPIHEWLDELDTTTGGGALDSDGGDHVGGEGEGRHGDVDRRSRRRAMVRMGKGEDYRIMEVTW